MRYDHDHSTFHMYQYKASKWDPKIKLKYGEVGQLKARQAPFTLAQLRGRHLEK